MREPEPPSGIRQGDLAVVHVAGEHEVEAPRLELVEYPREMAEQDLEVRVAGERVRIRLGPAADDQPRVCARDPDRAPAELDQLPLVAQQLDGAELTEIRRPRLRVAGDGDVVVA